MPKPDDVFIGCYFKKKLVQKCFFPIMTKLEMSKNTHWEKQKCFCHVIEKNCDLNKHCLSHSFHIYKWLFFAISSFAIIEKISSEQFIAWHQLACFEICNIVRFFFIS